MLQCARALGTLTTLSTLAPSRNRTQLPVKLKIGWPLKKHMDGVHQFLLDSVFN